MRVLLMGASGMVGQGVLRECLLDKNVSEVVTPVRRPMPVAHDRLTQWVHPDMFAWDATELRSFDACFFCLGVSSLGLSEPEYRHVTKDLTLALATPLAAASPQATFVFVSGAGTDQNGRAMWARVKASAEDALQTLPFAGVYCFRPGFIQPLHGIRSRTGWYNAIYAVLGWIAPVLRRAAPAAITTTEAVGRAMLEVATHGWDAATLPITAINAAEKRYLERKPTAPAES